MVERLTATPVMQASCWARAPLILLGSFKDTCMSLERFFKYMANPLKLASPSGHLHSLQVESRDINCDID